MKKMLLMTLLFLSSWILSQNTVTPNISEAQIKEIYKGLKQNDYLKIRLQKTENSLSAAKNLISEQQKSISAAEKLAVAKDQTIANLEEIRKQENIVSTEKEKQLSADISILKADLEILSKEAKNKQRKKFWNGVKAGAFSVAIIGIAGIILIK